VDGVALVADETRPVVAGGDALRQAGAAVGAEFHHRSLSDGVIA
jgi:hypothetical protein